ncbi:MAG: lytic transglycosylase domain-containing protein [Pseudomonadota bacterium]
MMLFVGGFQIETTQASDVSSILDRIKSFDASAILDSIKPVDEAPTRLGPLPDILSDEDVDRYRQILEIQAGGDWQTADALIEAVEDPLLMGQVMAQRYLHPTAYISAYNELHGWLSEFADHPQAARVHRLAVKRRPGGAPSPNEPVEGYLYGSGQELLQDRPPRYRSGKPRTAAQSRAVQRMSARTIELVSQDRPTQALRELVASPDARYADQTERDLSRWWIARGYYANQKFEQAFDIASEAAKRSGAHEPRLHWTAGLAAWRLERYETALRHFRQLADSDLAGGEAMASGSFWAARAAIRAGQPDIVVGFLVAAADASDGFYGLLAKAFLGWPIAFDWNEIALQDDALDLLLQFPGSRRAIALHQIGQDDLAAAEIRKLAARSRPQLVKALTALAAALDLPAAQMRVAQRLRLQDGRRHDGAMYPIPDWQPASGFMIDRALTYAIARAESGFDPEAQSGSGAYGLMQIMPSTAEHMSVKASIDYGGKEALLSPEHNLELGQIYVEYLLNTNTVDHNLIHLCLAYNGGIKRLWRWKETLKDVADDPLLFLESVPVAESRLYAKKVMANLWAYRLRFNQPIPSLEALAANRWPQYYAYEFKETALAGPY